MANINSVITYNANLSAAQAQLKALTGQVGALTAAFNTLDKSALAAQRSLAAGFATNVGQIGGFTAQTVKATDATTNFGRQIAANRLTMREYFREAILGYRKVSQMRKLAEQQVRYQQSIAVPTGAGQAMMLTPTSIDSMASKTALASQRFSIFNQLIDGGATKMLNWGKNTQWAGRQLMVGFTMPLMLFTAVASKQFRDLDKELTRFQKVYGSDLGNAVSDTTQRMREQVKQLAFDISRTYGIAAKETAALAADIAATGAEGEQLISSVQQTTRLAVLGEVDRQEAMKATLALQSAFKLNTNELAESINFLNAVENQTSATLEDLATAIPKVGPVVRSLGGDVEDLATLLVAMREGGIPAAEAANALKSGLASLINPTKQASLVAQQFGVDLVGIVNANKGQLMPTIYAVQEALSGLDSFARSRIIEQIFGKYQFARITALFDNIGRVGSQTQSVIELATKSSAELAAVANGEIRTLTESTAVKFQRTVENLKNAIIPLGEALTETLIPVFETIGKVMGGLQSFFQALPEPIKGFAKLSIAIAAVAGPIIMLVGLFGNLIANGIKFSMGIARIGARLAGLKFGKFELLDEITMAAKLGIDNLSLSFTNQETALNKLNRELLAYQNSLSRLTVSNPALFIPGAIPRGGVMPLAPIKRQPGSQTPERIPGGYGGGDRVPALLEPGEMVVRKEAAAQYGPIIAAMNRGSVIKLAQGDQTQLSHLSAPINVRASQLLSTGLLADKVATMMGLLGNQLVTIFSNFVVAFKTETNQALRPGNRGAQVSSVVSQLQSQKAWEKIMTDTGLKFQELQPVIKMVTDRLNGLNQELINDPQLWSIVEDSVRTLANSSNRAAQTLQVLSNQYGVFGLNASQAEILRKSGISFGSGERERLGVGIAPPYTTTRTGRGIPIQNMKYYDFTGKGIAAPPIQTPASYTATPARVPGGIESITNAQRLATAQKSLVGYMTMRERLLIKIIQSEGQEANIRTQMDRITRDTSLTLEQKLALQRKMNDELQVHRTKTKLLQETLERTDRNIINAKERQLAATMAIGPGYFGGVNPYAAGSRTGPSTTIMPVAGSRFGNLTREERKQLAEMRRQGLDPSTRQRYEMGLLRKSGITPTGGPSQSLAAARENAQMGGMRGQGAMNAAFMVSMLVSSFSMVSGSSQEVAGKLALLSTAVMAASTAMMMFSGKNVAGNFLGLGSLGGMLKGAGVAQRGAATAAMGGAAAARAAGGIGRTGAGLIQAGSVLSTLGGPAGMAAAAGITALVGSIILYRKSIEDAEAKAVSAFVEPAKSAEFFGKTIRDVSQELKDAQVTVPGLEEIDEGLREAVKQDYGILIDKIRFGSAEAGARELSLAFNKMIASGLSAEDAKAAVQAIAIEAGAVGGESFAKAMRQGMLTALTPVDVAENTAKMFDVELMTKNAEAIQNTINTLDRGFIQNVSGNIAQLLNNSILGVDLKSLPFFLTMPTLLAGIFTDIDDRLSQQITGLANYTDNMEQLMANLAENLDVSSGQIVSVVETLYATFKEAPTETMQAFDDIAQAALDLSAIPFDPVPIQEFLNTLDPIAAITLSPLIQDNERLALAIMKAVTAGMSLQEILTALQNGSLDTEIELTVRVAEQEVGLSELKQTVSDELTAELDAATEEVDANIEGINKKIERLGNVSKRHIGVLTKAFNQDQRASEALIGSLEDQSEAIQDNIDAKREDFEERMQDLEDERDAIEEGSDAYIESLQKRSKADSFYAQQRKTSLSALQRLASGDVFGFLQERQQMSQDAQKFSYDEQISGIEERRDLELDAIDETMEKERRKQEQFEKNEKAKIDAINDQIDAERELMDQRQKDFDRTVRIYERQVKKKEESLKDELTAEQGHRAALEKLRNGEIKSQQDLYKALDESSANYYMEQQKRILKEQMALEIGRIRQEFPDISLNEVMTRAYGNLKPMFDAMYERKGVGMDFMQSDLAAIGYTYSTAGPGRPGDRTYRPGNTGSGGTTPTNTGQNNPGFDVTKYDSRYPQTRVGKDGITYIWNGDRYVPQYASGGKVTGPGGPKSDSIPAMLSNGEYVIQASSVNKYGTELMDTINAGKYADGGIVKARDGAYISADRAETKANNNVYAGGWKPKPQYSGGTPTYSGGYNSANTQSYSNIYGRKKNKSLINYNKVQNYDSNVIDPNSIGAANAFSSFMIDALRWMAAGAVQLFGGAMDAPSITDPVANFVGGESYASASGLEKTINAVTLAIPIPSFGLGAKTASLIGRSMTRAQRRTGMNIGPAQYTQRQGAFEQLIEQKYGDQIVGNLIRASDDPTISGLPAGMRLESHLGPSTGALNAFGHKYALTEAAKNKAAIIGADVGDKPIKIMSADTVRKNIDIAINAVNKSNSNARLLTSMWDTGPYRVIQSLSSADPEFAALSLAEKQEITSFLASSSFNTNKAKNLSTSSGFDNFTWNDGQVNMINPITGRFGLLNTMAHEMGHTTDFMFNRSGYGYGIRNIPENANPLTKWYLSKVNSIKQANQSGKTEAYAESNRLRAIKALMEDAGLDPALITRFTREGGGVGPYSIGVRPGSYANSPLFKISYAMQMRRNMKGQDALFDTRGFSMRKSGIFSDMITSTPEWLWKMLMQKAGRISGYAEGGPVELQKFAKGGLVAEGGETTKGRTQSPRFISGILSLLNKEPKKNKNGGYVGGYNGAGSPDPSINSVISLANKYSNLPYSDKYPIPVDRNGNPTGWGCATSVAWLYQKGAGINLPSPSLSYGQYQGLKENVSRNSMLPGDLVFYYNKSGVNTQNPVNHVEMYMGPGKIFNGGVGIQSGFSNHPVVGIKRVVSASGPRSNNSSGNAGMLLFGDSIARDLHPYLPSTFNGQPIATSYEGGITPSRAIAERGSSISSGPNKVLVSLGTNGPGPYPTGNYEADFSAAKFSGQIDQILKLAGLNRMVYWMTNVWSKAQKYNSVIKGKAAARTNMEVIDTAGMIERDPSMWIDDAGNKTSWGNHGKHPSSLAYPSIASMARNAIGFASGGFISGPGGPRSDMIPAMLSNGEYVVKASSVDKYGKGFMDQINAGQFSLGGLATTAPRMSSPTRYAGGGFVGSMSAATPTFGMPQMNAVSPTDISANITNAFGGSNSSSTSNSSSVKVIINGAGGKSAKAIANRVISIINEANGRRNHSRSI